MYRDIVTVFNRTKTREGDIWYPTVIPGVNLNMDRGAIVEKYGEQSQDNCILNVRYKNLKKAYLIRAWPGMRNLRKSSVPIRSPEQAMNQRI